MPRRTRTTAALAATTVLAIAGALGAPAGAAGEGTYTNPVSESFAGTYADPAVIQAKDGWWYAYATADPLKAGQPLQVGHIARTRNWVDWEYVGPIFTDANRPAWATKSASLWAPDCRLEAGRAPEGPLRRASVL